MATRPYTCLTSCPRRRICVACLVRCHCRWCLLSATAAWRDRARLLLFHRRQGERVVDVRTIEPFPVAGVRAAVHLWACMCAAGWAGRREQQQ